MTYDIIIDPNANTLYCKRTNNTYNIASGDIYGKHHSHPYYTPVGETTILEKRKVGNMFKPAFIRMGFLTLPNVALPKTSKPYLIHGPMDNGNTFTKDREFVDGGRLSKGCIRLKNNELMELFNNTRVGDKVLVKEYKDKKINNWVKKRTRNAN